MNTYIIIILIIFLRMICLFNLKMSSLCTFFSIKTCRVMESNYNHVVVNLKIFILSSITTENKINNNNYSSSQLELYI